MNLSFLTASRLRIILSVTMGLILFVAIGIFYLAYGMLGKSATETGDQVASARDSQNTLERLQTLKKDLESKQAIIDRTAQITASSQSIAFQTRIISDLTAYAERAHVSISNWSFDAGQPATSGTGAAGTVPAGGLSTRNLSVTLANPVNYTDYLNFLHYIEQNLTKLKISKVNLQKSSDGNGITTDILNIEVYVK